MKSITCTILSVLMCATIALPDTSDAQSNKRGGIRLNLGNKNKNRQPGNGIFKKLFNPNTQDNQGGLTQDTGPRQRPENYDLKTLIGASVQAASTQDPNNLPQNSIIATAFGAQGGIVNVLDETQQYEFVRQKIENINAWKTSPVRALPDATNFSGVQEEYIDHRFTQSHSCYISLVTYEGEEYSASRLQGMIRQEKWIICQTLDSQQWLPPMVIQQRAPIYVAPRALGQVRSGESTSNIYYSNAPQYAELQNPPEAPVQQPASTGAQ